jgi:hypothetical protein
MAGVQRQKDSKGKWRYRMQFYDTEGKRHSVWLGRVSSNHANDVASHIENLVDAAKHGSRIPAKTLADRAIEIAPDTQWKLIIALDALHASCSVRRPSLPQRSLGPVVGRC